MLLQNENVQHDVHVRLRYIVTVEPLATSENLPAAFIVCLHLQTDRCTILCVTPPPPNTTLTFHTGKYARHPLWLPRSLDRSDRWRQQHSAEDYAQSLPWWVQSHLLEWGKPLWQNLQILIITTDSEWHSTEKSHPTLPLNIKREICRILSDEFKWGSTFF